MRPAALVTAVFLVLIALLHTLRLVYQVPVTAGTTQIPLWASAVGVLVPGSLAWWLWREQRI